MSSALELQVQRKNTSAFIEADPKSLVFNRVTRTPNGSGGFTRSAPIAAPPQEGRIIPSQYQLPDRETSNGTIATPGEVLLLEWDADVRRFDQFTDGGILYEVVWVYPKREYETKCELVMLGGDQ